MLADSLAQRSDRERVILVNRNAMIAVSLILGKSLSETHELALSPHFQPSNQTVLNVLERLIRVLKLKAKRSVRERI